MVVTRTLPFHFYSPFCPETDDSHTNRTGKPSFVHLLITVPQFPALEFPGIWNNSPLCVCFGFVGYVCCAELRILKFLSLCSSNGKFSSRIVVLAFCILLVALELQAFFLLLFFLLCDTTTF
jgi:hypothetical protein